VHDGTVNSTGSNDGRVARPMLSNTVEFNMIKLENILVATDFGEASDSALSYGRQLARKFGARLHLIHVVDRMVTWTGIDGIATDFAALQVEIEDAAREKLRLSLSEEDRRELKATSVVHVAASPAFAIVAYAKESNADLLIVGTHGRGAMAHLLMGSVAEKVVRIAPCPVLTVRSPEHEFVLPDALQLATVTAGL
jgi:nucleotide-binding universal stress UspA family protein